MLNQHTSVSGDCCAYARLLSGPGLEITPAAMSDRALLQTTELVGGSPAQYRLTILALAAATHVHANLLSRLTEIFSVKYVCSQLKS